MKNPYPVHLQTSAEVRAVGWGAESRDDDRHLCTTHVKFDDDKAMVQYIRQCLEDGQTVTIWPHKIATKSDYPAWAGE
jgi:hypothetical protein